MKKQNHGEFKENYPCHLTTCLTMCTWNKWIWSTNCKFVQCKVDLGMSNSLVHMHNCWKSFVVSWQKINRNKEISTTSKAIWDQSIWIWHCTFGMPSDNIDISVCYTSSFWLQGARNNISFEVNGHHYMNYFEY
jgi:hypothetical protein